MVAQLDPLYTRTRPYKAAIRLCSHFLFQGRFLTTNNRWLNKFILAELAGIKRFSTFRRVKEPIFIIGTGRSGSTILGKVLSMHRSIGFLNEPKIIWYVIDPRDDVNGHFQLDKAQYRFIEEDATGQKQVISQRIFGFYLAITSSKRLVDKNPEIIYRIPYVRKLFPDAKFILLIRNGWDTVHSIASWSSKERLVRNGNVENWWGLNLRKWKLMVEQLIPLEPLLADNIQDIRGFTREEDMAAVEWILAMQEGLRNVERIPQSIYTLHYEDLTQNPRFELEKLSEFCNLSKDSVFLSYGERVLATRPSKSPLELNPAIREAFTETMELFDFSPSNGTGFSIV